MMERGDKYFMAICNTTGTISIYNPAKNLFLSPAADGPIRFNESIDGKAENIQQITKFGRSFSIVSVPYTLKLLIHELQTMGIHMHIITEDNIEQLENLSYSKNIELATRKIGITSKEIVSEIRYIINRTKPDIRPVSLFEPITPEINQPLFFEPRSPEETPPYAPNSPAYEPRSPAYAPPYEPSSPPYATGSPAYSPGSEESFSGGAQKTNEEYQVGENVFYRGGNNPNRLWKIKKKAILLQLNVTTHFVSHVGITGWIQIIVRVHVVVNSVKVLPYTALKNK
jgi:hypothetical protein